MNHVAAEIKDVLMHYGMPRRSGRYPWGSGKNPYQHSADFLARVDELKKDGLSEKEIAKAIYGKDGTTSKLRTQYSIAKNERRADQVATAKGLRDKGYSLNEIARRMGFENDSSVRSLLNESSEKRMNQAREVADFLKKMVDEKGMIDVGAGVEKELGNISREKLKQALDILEMEGYPTYGGGLPQVTNQGKQTNLKVLCPPGTEHKEIYNYDQIHSVVEYDKMLTKDGERRSFEYPESMDSRRLQIRYAEQGGDQQDGLIEIRRGVQDLDLGDAHYAQVRILVDKDRYLKGMAVYADDLPDGVDVRFNTNKHLGTDTRDVLKKVKDDPTNPFGSLIKEHGGQSYYKDPKGRFTNPLTGEKESLSLINKRSEEGDWLKWDNSHLPAQFLSKQSMEMINKQLNLAKSDKKAEFDEICSLTNPTVKRELLSTFANDCDSAAVHLQAAALPRQKYHVLLPLKTVKDSEVYAPNYNNGEKVALIRYPHGGTFEIPILTVNNKVKEGKNMMGSSPKDAVGISKKVADRLSGADFDGDTVMVIPLSSKVKVTATHPLKDLEGFDPKESYGADSPGSAGRNYKKMKNTQNEMGKISNLITDMTLQGAKDEEIARAVKHSMVVIDAEKHGLDYKRSYEENGIAALKKRYQGRIDETTGKYSEGAATLISRAKGETSVPKRKGSPMINQKGKPWYDPSLPEGAEMWKTDTEHLTYTDKKGKTVTRTQASTQMAETRDAFSLVSETDTPQERAYASYANEMKALANAARKEMVYAGRLKYQASAKSAYQQEADSLTAKLNLAKKNAPREREAQRLASVAVEMKKQANPDMKKAEIKKTSQIELDKARTIVGSSRRDVAIDITDREWEAIQAGAISDNQLSQMLKYVNIDLLRERATPRTNKTLSSAKVSQIQTMANSGYTNQEIADRLGVSTSTVSKYL